MAYGNDELVYVGDKAGDGGVPGAMPFWLSPDVDIPAHSGVAFQGPNDVQIRVHCHEEPFLEEKITAEVYVGDPGFVMSPTLGTRRIDPGGLTWRPSSIPGTEPVADEVGSTQTFSWTPSSSATDVAGPGHRCLVVRAFPVSVTPPSAPFDVANEQHEAQHNIEVLSTTKSMKGGGSGGGAGTPGDPKHRDPSDGMWWERFTTMAPKRRGKRYIVWAFDPKPSNEIVEMIGPLLKKSRVKGFSDEPPAAVTLVVEKPARGGQIGVKEIDADAAGSAGIGKGLFARKRLVAAAEIELGPRTQSSLVMRFDHSNIQAGTAAMLHAVQLDERGHLEGGMTVVARAPTR